MLDRCGCILGSRAGRFRVHDRPEVEDVLYPGGSRILGSALSMPSCRPSDYANSTRPWKHGPIPVLGLIGGIGSGKSAVAAILAAKGGVVIDADRVGHELLCEPEIRDQIVARWGDTVLDRTESAAIAGPRIDRRALGAIVFADPENRRELEAIVHPRMRDRFRREIERLTRLGEARVIVLDAAILCEAGWDDLCDRVVFVDAPLSVRRRRVATQRGWSLNALESREAAQWPCDIKRSRADIVLANDSGMDDLESEVGRLDDLLGDSTRPFTCSSFLRSMHHHGQ
jgi:dephospho-CoA kinase